MNVESRFMSKVLVNTETDCWEWQAAIQPNGYGYFGLSKEEGMKYAHRISYELFRGPIEEGKQIDHLCRNRCCVNPSHLEVVDCRTNLLRGNTITRRNAEVTVCPQGHSYTPENTGVRAKDGSRWCRACNRDRQKALRRFI